MTSPPCAYCGHGRAEHGDGPCTGSSRALTTGYRPCRCTGYRPSEETP